MISSSALGDLIGATMHLLTDGRANALEAVVKVGDLKRFLLAVNDYCLGRGVAPKDLIAHLDAEALTLPPSPWNPLVPSSHRRFAIQTNLETKVTAIGVVDDATYGLVVKDGVVGNARTRLYDYLAWTVSCGILSQEANFGSRERLCFRDLVEEFQRGVDYCFARGLDPEPCRQTAVELEALLAPHYREWQSHDEAVNDTAHLHYECYAMLQRRR